MEDIQLTFYLVRNKEGKYFRSKGYGGYGETWVSDVKKARVYQKIGQARTRVSFFANTYPEYGVPELLELTTTETAVLDETERVAKAAKSKEKAELKRQEAYLEYERQALVREQASLDKKKKRLGL